MSALHPKKISRGPKDPVDRWFRAYCTDKWAKQAAARDAALTADGKKR